MTTKMAKPLPLDAPESEHIACDGNLSSLFWPLSDPPNISILSDFRDPDQPKEPYIQEHGLHPIADDSIVNPPVSSLRVEIEEFVGWSVEWYERHDEHDDDEDRLYRNDKGDTLTQQELEELDSAEANVTFGLYQCCGETAPQMPESITVHASRKPFVTVADYVAALHPFLMAHRQQLIIAGQIHTGQSEPELIVNPIGISRIQIQTKETWGTDWGRQNGNGQSRIRHPRTPVPGHSEITKYPVPPVHIRMTARAEQAVREFEEKRAASL